MRVTNLLIGKILFVLLTFWLMNAGNFSALAADNPSTQQRPKVGLVLSGGGARGLAHIGVIEWFEKHHVPVDYVAGTSMGGLIGGLYAMGMSPDEMRAFVRGIDWSKVFGKGIEYRDLSFRRKEDKRAYQVDLEIGLRNGLSIPSGLSSGHEVGLLIDRVTLPYSTVTNFDDLPIPFRCMGTDAINAKEVVMKDGLLSTAMRATMSIPGVFPPVKRDGVWLIDGGVLNNIPTDVMRGLGPDVVIAVNVGTPLGTEKSMNSMFGVVGQTIGVMTAGSDRTNLPLADLVIKPALGEKSNLDFVDPDKTADLGYPAAEEQMAFLETYAVDDAAWQEYAAQRDERKRVTLAAPVDLQVTGTNPRAEKNVRDQLFGFVGRPVNTALLERALTRLAGEGRYQSVDYGFLSGEGGKNILEIRVREKNYAPPTLNFAFGIEGTDISDFNFSAGTRLTFYDIGSYGSELRNDIDFGVESLLASEYYRPLGRSGLFVAPRLDYLRGKESLFVGGERLAEYDVNRYGVGADIGFGTWRTELRLGAEVQRFDASLSTGASSITSIKGPIEVARLRWAYDGSNSPTIPTRGARITTELRYYFDSPLAEGDFTQGEVRTSVFHPISRPGTLFVAGSLGTTFSKNAAPAQIFMLGGPYRLGAYDPGEFSGNHYILVSAGYLHQIGQLSPLIGGKVWLTGWFETGSAFDDFNNIDYRNQVSAGLLVDTRLGPFSLIAAYGEGNKSNIYFSFGKFL
jgi:NTE family protein